jgi:hypothetical protein
MAKEFRHMPFTEIPKLISKDKNNCIKLSFDIYQKTSKKIP